MAREQGAGDAIQFARYRPLAAGRGGRLILVCRAELMLLFATLPGIAEIREPGTFQVAEFDTYTPLLSLPHLFGTTLETIPALIPYLDVALLRRRKAIALPQASKPSRRKIGLVWAGSPTHQNDRHRSSALAAFLPVVRTPGIAFYSVQKGERSQDLG
jgi:hypothetical protein